MVGGPVEVGVDVAVNKRQEQAVIVRIELEKQALRLPDFGEVFAADARPRPVNRRAVEREVAAKFGQAKGADLAADDFVAPERQQRGRRGGRAEVDAPPRQSDGRVDLVNSGRPFPCYRSHATPDASPPSPGSWYKCPYSRNHATNFSNPAASVCFGA